MERPNNVLAVRIAAFICAVLLSLLCGLLYNLRKYEIERIEQEKGGWHSRITGVLGQEEIAAVRSFAHVEDVVVSAGKAEDGEVVLDIYFDPVGAVLKETLQIAGMLGSFAKVSYNDELLAMYWIRSPQDRAPRLVFPLFIFIVAIASASLVMIIRHAFAVSMNNRVRQLGILSSIGVTPKQIRGYLLGEAAALCTAPVFAGVLLGQALEMFFLHLSNVLLGDGIVGRHRAVFGCHPLVLGLTVLIIVLTIGVSAWIPAWKLSRLGPMEAIKSAGALQLKRRKDSRLLFLFFGVEGELAGNALQAQKKALRTALLSLVLSFLAFAVMQCFFTMSEISTRETYFERYQEAWDIMVAVKGAEMDSMEEAKSIRRLPGVESAVVYQKAMAGRRIAKKELSEEMQAFGGFSHASADKVKKDQEGWLVHAPLVILDDDSFREYCAQIGIAPRLDGAVIRNQIRDVTNPDFRHPVSVPYIRERKAGENAVSVLLPLGGELGEEEKAAKEDSKEDSEEEKQIKIPVLSYTDKVPLLREEYATLDAYELVHFIPATLWREIEGQIGEGEENSFIRVLCDEDVPQEQVEALQREIEQIVGPDNVRESENRVEEYALNSRKIQGMKAVLGSFCVLLALIGIGNVFSNTLGFVHQRKREWAMYMSVGMTPGEIRKMFFIEALVLAGRPILFALLLAAAAVGVMLKMSYLAVGEFLAEMPVFPMVSFMAGIFGAVALAYFFSWKQVQSISLAELLRDDTML